MTSSTTAIRAPPTRFGWPLRLLWRAYHLSWWPQRLLLNRADAVVTVSETTRRLIEHHRLTRRPVTVVPNAADPPPAGRPAEGAPTIDNHRSRSLVYTGAFMPYKNVELLARALRELPGFTLHLISAITAAQRARFDQLAPPDSIVYHNAASEEEYRRTLAAALALVTASLDEGFGIPIVEAMALGIPVVVSDIDIFREVAGSAGLFADPGDPSAFAAAVRRLTDREVWRHRSTLCHERSRRFSWDTAAEGLLALLAETADL